MGIKALAKALGKTMKEAEEYRKEYFAKMPNAKTFMDNVEKVLKARKYVYNRFKRRYWLDASRAYVAVNYLVQGTSADIVKNRLNACHEYLIENNLKSRILVQVHDELIFEIANEEASWLPWKLKEIMEEKQIDAFLPVEISRGAPSWAQPDKWVEDDDCWESEQIAA